MYTDNSFDCRDCSDTVADVGETPAGATISYTTVRSRAKATKNGSGQSDVQGAESWAPHVGHVDSGQPSPAW